MTKEKEWYNQKGAVIAIHIFVWALLYSLPFLLHPTYEKPQMEQMTEHKQWLLFLLAYYLIQVIFFYTNAFLLIPSLVRKKRIAEYVGVLVSSSCFTAVSVMHSKKYS